MSEQPEQARLRIGAVGYLNARPLTYCLPRLAPQAEMVVDLPSRLAEGLAAGRLDVAMIPSIEYARGRGYAILSDACVACDGRVRSVKLYGRVPPERIRTLALDEGSRTSAALARILLREQFGLDPQIRPMPIGAALEDTAADAVVLIGDRGMRPADGPFAFVWDLGERWSQWTGLPLVFAMWIGRSDAELGGIAGLLAAARDQGVARLEEIARAAAPQVGLPEEECLTYLRDHLQFRLGPRQREGLRRFFDLAARHGLAPAGAEISFYDEGVAR